MNILYGILCLLVGLADMYLAYITENKFIKVNYVYCAIIMVVAGICRIAM